MMINSRVLCDHAADGDTNKLRALLMDYADPDSKSESGVPALCLAARAGHADTVSVLLDFEADVTAADAEGVGALVLRGWTLQDAWAAVHKARPGAKIGPKRWRALVQAFGDEVEGIQAAACEICPAAFAEKPAEPAKRETEPGSSPPAAPDADPSRPLRINVPLKQ